MANKLIDCGKKAVAAGILGQEEVDFVRKKAKDLASTMPPEQAEMAAARSMIQDGIAELQNIRHQLGKDEPMKQPVVVFRTTNKEAAMAAMMDETQMATEGMILRQAEAANLEAVAMQAAQQKAEDAVLGEVSLEAKRLPAEQAVPLSELEPLRETSTRPSSELIKSIKEQGVREPISVTYDPEAGTMVVDDGAHRINAARKAGMTSIPVRFRTGGLSPQASLPAPSALVARYRKGAQEEISVGARGVKAPIVFKRSVEELTALAKDSEKFKMWYSEFNRFLTGFLGPHAEYGPLVSEFLSATSAAELVGSNVTKAVEALKQFIETGTVPHHLAAQAGNLERAIKGEKLSGPKIGEFSEAIFGNEDAIAVDRHVAMIIFGANHPSPSQIKAAKPVIRQIAETLGWTPGQAQAALWGANIKLSGKVVESYERYLENFRTQLHALLAEDRAGAQRGLQASRRISERIGQAAGSARGLVRELIESGEVDEDQVAAAVAGGPLRPAPSREGSLRGALARSQAADKYRPLFAKLGVQWVQKAELEQGGMARAVADQGGNIRIEIGTSLLDDAERISAGKLEPGTITRTALAEELIHAAHFLAVRKEWMAEGSPGSFVGYNKKANLQVFASIHHAMATAPPVVKRNIQKAVMASYSAYFDKFQGSPSFTDTETILRDIAESGNAINFVAEFLRQVVQLKQNGDITEGVYSRLWTALQEWVTNALNRIRTILPEAFAGAFGKETQRVLQSIEAVLDDGKAESASRAESVMEKARAVQEELAVGAKAIADVQRYLAGVSQETPDFQPNLEQQEAVAKDFLSQLVSMPGIMRAKVKDSLGMFMGTPERNFDVDIGAAPGTDPTGIVKLVAKIGGAAKQQKVFVARELDGDEVNANARPGLEVTFRDEMSLEEIQPVMQYLVDHGVDGFTFQVDPSRAPAQRPDHFRGVLFQYIPEFSDNTKWVDDAAAIEKTLLALRSHLRSMPGVETVGYVRYDTLVLTDRDYDARGISAISPGASRAAIWSKRASDAGSPQGAGGGTKEGGQAVQGAAVSRGVQEAVGPRGPPRPVDREAEITAAVERLNRDPGERVAVYQKIRDRLLATMRKNRVEAEAMEFERGMTEEERAAAGITTPPAQHEIQREKLLSALGELNALLKFLPAEVRGKVGGFFTLAKGGMGERDLADFFVHRIRMVEKELERLLKNDYISEIEKILKATKPVTLDSGIKKSKIGDAQVAADIARKAAKMSADETAAQMALLDSAMTNPDLTPEEHSDLLYEWGITSAFGDLHHRNAESLSSAYAWLRETVLLGRQEWAAKEQARLEGVRGFSSELVEGLPAITKAGLVEAEWDQAITQYLDSMEFNHYSFAQFLTQILPEGATVIKRWQDMARKADHASQDYAIKAGDKLTAHLQEAIGTKSKLAMGRALWHLKKVQPAIKIGEEMIPMTRLQAIQNLLSWAQPDVREKMEADGWTEADMDAMRALTSDEISQAMLEYLREEYAAGYALVNPLYKRMFGMDMPKVDFYAPTRYHHRGLSDEISLFGGPMSVSGVTPGFAIGRVRHSARIKQADALTVYHQHVAQQGHWLAYAELLREMRGVLGDPDVKMALLQKYGQATVQGLDKWVDALARQGGNKASELMADNWLLDKLITAKAVSSLGLNMRTVAMQLDSSLRMTLALPMRRVIAAMLDRKFISTLPTAWKSGSIQRRVYGGANPAAKYLFDQTRARPSTMLELARLSMMPMQIADGLLTSFSSAVVYRDAYNSGIEQGMNEQEAEAHAAESMDDAIYRYNQPVGMASKSLSEVSGGQLKKIFMMFMSDPRLKTAIMAESIRGLATGKGDARTHVARLIAIEAMSIVSHIISSIYRDAFTGDEDDEIWTWQGFALAGALPMLSGYFIAGAAGTALFSQLLENRFWSPSQNPLIDAFERGSQAANHLDDLINTDDPQAMFKEWNNIARAAAIFGPASAVPAVILNAIKPLVGALENEEKED